MSTNLDIPGLERLYEAYPHIRGAIVYVEGIICTAPEGETPAWDLFFRTTRPVSVKDVVEILQNCVENEKSTIDREGVIRRQMDHPEFARYIAGKMGCV